jgi:hypothetical protein
MAPTLPPTDNIYETMAILHIFTREEPTSKYGSVYCYSLFFSFLTTAKESINN